MDSYGIYLNIRDNAWNCLIENKICALPVDLLKITGNGHNIRVIKNSSVRILDDCENGRSYYDGRIWYIIYDDNKPRELIRYTVAHELGHYFLCHELKYAIHSNFGFIQKCTQSERYADMFARRILCPSCVLWGMGLHTPFEIAYICGVDCNVAIERARRLELLYTKNRFLINPHERELYRLFMPYIEKESKERKNT